MEESNELQIRNEYLKSERNKLLKMLQDIKSVEDSINVKLEEISNEIKFYEVE